MLPVIVSSSDQLGQRLLYISFLGMSYLGKAGKEKKNQETFKIPEDFIFYKIIGLAFLIIAWFSSSDNLMSPYSKNSWMFCSLDHSRETLPFPFLSPYKLYRAHITAHSQPQNTHIKYSTRIMLGKHGSVLNIFKYKRNIHCVLSTSEKVKLCRQLFPLSDLLSHTQPLRGKAKTIWCVITY